MNRSAASASYYPFQVMRGFLFGRQGDVYYIGGNDILTLSFQRFLFLRNSCYNCHFSNEKRVADFTCGDIWSFDNKKSNIILKNGVSFVRCNNNRALSIFSTIKNCNYVEVDEKNTLKSNVPFHTSVKKPFFRYISYKFI